MNITYGIANSEDAYGIEYVSAHSWMETYLGLLPDDYLNNRIRNIENKIEDTKNFLKNYDGKYIVAKDDDRVIGILVYGYSKEEKYKEYGHLDAIYVLKDYQGLGVGKELFKIAVSGLIEMGYSKMQLECMQGNNTLNFYKKYLGVVNETIDYPIKDICVVKADIILFENLNDVLKKINESSLKNKLNMISKKR